MALYSLILPYYNHWELTHERLSEIYHHLFGDFEVVLVNDASEDIDCRTGAAWWQKSVKLFPIRYLENKENLGFGGSHNRGAKSATGSILIFLSNDVIISGNFLPEISAQLDLKKGNVIIGGRVLIEDTGWNTLTIKGKKSIVPYPEGWMIAVTAEMWKRIGGWDVDTYGKFDVEDLDLGAWAAYNDVPIVGLNSRYLKHLFGQTIGTKYSDRQDYTIRNIKKFQNKWTKLLEEKFL